MKTTLKNMIEDLQKLFAKIGDIDEALPSASLKLKEQLKEAADLAFDLKLQALHAVKEEEPAYLTMTPKEAAKAYIEAEGQHLEKEELNFEDALSNFIHLWKIKLMERKEAMGLTYFDDYALDLERGKKYIRIVRKERKNGENIQHSGSSAAFIDMTNGDVLKCDSYKKPAKHPRGNIYSDRSGMEAIDSGAFVRYLK